MSKALLKAAKDAIGNGDYEAAMDLIEQVQSMEPKNYTSYVFLGLIQTKLKATDEAEAAYERAIGIDHNASLAYQGLCNLYESLKDPKLVLAYERLVNMHLRLNEVEKAHFAWKKWTDLASDIESLKALQMMLPGSILYGLLLESGTACPSPLETLTTMIRIREDYDAKWTKTEMDTQKHRLTSDPWPVVQARIEAECIANSNLDELYGLLLERIPSDDPLYTSTCVKYLEYLYRKLCCAEPDQKNDLCEKVVDLAKLLVAMDVSFSSPCYILLQITDARLRNLNQEWVTKVSSSDSPVQRGIAQVWLDWKSGAEPLPLLDQLDSIASEASSETLWHRLRVEILLLLQRHELAIEGVDVAFEQVELTTSQTGTLFPKALMELHLTKGNATLCLGSTTILLSEALNEFKHVLTQHPKNVDALLGLGQAFSGLSKHDEAKKVLSKALTLDPENSNVNAEFGWVLFLSGDTDGALRTLLDVDSKSNPHYKVKFRIASVYWALGDKYRSEKEFTHAFLISSARLNPHFSGTFSLLGQYYELIEIDVPRAVKCYIKALSIHPGDEVAAKQLSYSYLSNPSHVQDGIALLKAFVEYVPRAAWAWKTFGIQSLARHQAHEAVTQFQTCLRLQSDDVSVWASLGEAYAMEGKYTASIKALERALKLDESNTHAMFIKASVEQELGTYDVSVCTFYSLLAILNNSHLLKIPTLKGLCDTLLLFGKDSYLKGFYGGSLDSLHDSLKYAMEAASISIDSFCFFQIIGDACLAMYESLVDLLNSVGVLDTAKSVLKLLKKTMKTMNIRGAFEISMASVEEAIVGCALNAYQVAVASIEAGGSVFLDLIPGLQERQGIAAFHLAAIRHKSGKCDEIEHAIQCLQKTVGLVSSDSGHWNTFAIILSQAYPGQAQAAFIRSLQLDPSNANAWSNLGYFYFSHQDLGLATKCYQRAQFEDSEAFMGWFGHGLVEKTLGNPDLASSLFAHSLEVGEASHVEVLYHLAEGCFDSDFAMAALPRGSQLDTASYCLLKAVERKSRDPSIFNLYGLVLERQKLYAQAMTAFKKAIALLGSLTKESMAVYENLGRVCCSNGDFDQAIDNFTKCVHLSESLPSQLDSYPYVGLGLSYFFLGNLSESLVSFEKALSICDHDDNKARLRLKNDTTLNLSQVLFALGSEQHIELAKQQLLECFQNDPNYVQAIISLCRMGLVYGDLQLAHTAAAELIGLDVEVIGPLESQVDLVLAHLFSLEGQESVARRFLIKSVHRYPHRAKRWSDLVAWIHRHGNMALARPCGQAAARLGQSDYGMERSPHELAELHVNVGLSIISSNPNTRGARTHLSKAIRASPSTMKHWIGLGLVQRAISSSSLGLIVKTIKVLTPLSDSDDGLWTLLLQAESVLMDESQEVSQDLVHALHPYVEDPSVLIRSVSCLFLGRLLFKMGNKDEWQVYMNEATKLSETFGSILAHERLASMQDPVKSLATLDRAQTFLKSWKEVNPVDPSTETRLHLRLAQVCLKLKDTVLAMKHVQDALFDPQCGPAKIVQAQVMIETGHTAKVPKLLEPLKDLYPFQVSTLMSRL